MLPTRQFWTSGLRHSGRVSFWFEAAWIVMVGESSPGTHGDPGGLPPLPQPETSSVFAKTALVWGGTPLSEHAGAGSAGAEGCGEGRAAAWWGGWVPTRERLVCSPRPGQPLPGFSPGQPCCRSEGQRPGVGQLLS